MAGRAGQHRMREQEACRFQNKGWVHTGAIDHRHVLEPGDGTHELHETWISTSHDIETESHSFKNDVGGGGGGVTLFT